MNDITDLDDARRFLSYAPEFVVGDCRVHRIPEYNHGWTVTRDNGQLVLIVTGDHRWANDSEYHPRDVMRFFAYLSDALESAEDDYIKRTGKTP